MEEEKVRVYKRRWYILFVFSLLTFYQCCMWITFSPVAVRVEKFYNIDEPKVNLLLSWGPIWFVVALPIVLWAVQRRDGLRDQVILGAFLVAAGSVIRCSSIYSPQAPWSYWMVSLGQIFIALAGPILLVAPPKISAIWFPTEERTFATGIGAGLNFTAIAFISAPLIVRLVGLREWLVYQAAGGAIIFVLILCYFPNAPPTPPTNSAKLREDTELKFTFRNYLLGIKEVIKMPPVAILALVGGWQAGASTAWQSLLDFLLQKSYSDEIIGYLGFANSMCYVLGCVLGGYLCDKWFQRRFKRVLIVCFILAIICHFLFTISFPSFISKTAIINSPLWFIILLGMMSGFLFGIVYPVYLELAAEMSYPLNEFYSAAFITFLVNVVTLLVLIVGSYIPNDWITGGVTASFIICTVLLCFVKETYRRLDVDTKDNYNALLN